MHITCPNAATCPSATRLDDGTWMIVGRQITDAAAREHGGNPSDDEGAVIVPGEIVEGIIEQIRQQLARDILGLKRYYGDNVHARFALDYAADIARGTKVELRSADDTTKESR